MKMMAMMVVVIMMTGRGDATPARSSLVVSFRILSTQADRVENSLRIVRPAVLESASLTIISPSLRR